MALEPYNTKIRIDGDVFWHRPRSYILPQETEKYILTRWNTDYSLFRLSYLTYGRSDLYWLILSANDKVSPYDFTNGEEIRILLPKFLNEVIGG